MKNKGFTLAEVLITLGIIGVVAAMTIPTLMNKTGNAEFVAGFKKEYSAFSQAWEQMLTDNGGSSAGVYSTSDEALDALCSKLRCTKTCHSGDDKTKCYLDTNWKRLNGVAGDQSFLGLGNGILSDGSAFSILQWDPTCAGFCAQLNIDTNSFKKPNVMGRDIFELFIYQDRVIANGANGTGFAGQVVQLCGGDLSQLYSGATCGARILLDNGMKY